MWKNAKVIQTTNGAIYEIISIGAFDYLKVHTPYSQACEQGYPPLKSLPTLFNVNWTTTIHATVSEWRYGFQASQPYAETFAEHALLGRRNTFLERL